MTIGKTDPEIDCRHGNKVWFLVPAAILGKPDDLNRSTSWP
jgi:hypothetical protein